MTKSLYELIDLAKPFLRQYLIDNGVEIVRKGTNEFFCCIHPDHEDQDPSNGFIKGSNDTAFHCFSCLCGGDIYTAAAYLENKPLTGLGFIKDNLEYILKKYNVEFEALDLSTEQLDRLKYETLYDTVYQIMSQINPVSEVTTYTDLTYAKERGWSQNTCRSMGIGSIRDFDTFIDVLKKRTGYNQIELEKMGIHNKIFGPDLLTFCVKDHTGKIVGFATRYNKWTKNCSEPKYRNTSINECPYYQKEKILYCMDLAKSYINFRLDIFEGYGSAVTAHQAAYKSCVSIGGTALTNYHVDLIRNFGFKHINLVLDADDTGSKLMEKYIERFSGHKDLQITFTKLKFKDEDKLIAGANDPDYFIKTYGINEYKSIKPEGVFEHMIRKYADFANIDSNPVFTKDFINQMIKLIINEPNNIDRGEKVKILSNLTKIDREDIKLEIERLEKTDVKSFKDDLSKKIRQAYDHDQLLDTLGNAMSSIQDNNTTKKERYLVSVSETVEAFSEVFNEMNTQEEGVHGWMTGLTTLDSMLDGIPKPLKGGIAIGLAGAPQHGKSAIMLNIATRLATKNNDIAICYWAIDDHRKAISYRLVSMLSGVSMKKVRNTEKRTPEESKRIKDAQDIILELINSRKLSFKDDRYGRSKKKAENWIKETQDATGNPIVFCIDSLHNIQGAGDELRTKLVTSSGWAKSLTASVPCTVLATMELVKNRVKGERPTLTSISESGKMEFDFDTIGIVWNEAQGNYCDVSLVNQKWGDNGVWKPIIELSVQKNKSGSGEKGSVYFRYDPDTTGIVSCDSYIDQATSRPRNLVREPVIVNYSSKVTDWNEDS